MMNMNTNIGGNADSISAVANVVVYAPVIPTYLPYPYTCSQRACVAIEKGIETVV